MNFSPKKMSATISNNEKKIRIRRFPICAPNLLGWAQQTPKVTNRFGDHNVGGGPSRALNDLDPIFGNLFPHVDSEGDTYQIGIFELNSRAFVPVVEEDVEPGGFEPLG